MMTSPIAPAGTLRTALAGLAIVCASRGRAQSPPPPSSAKRIEVLVRSLNALTRPSAHYRLDRQPISPDSALLAVRGDKVLNVVVFTGSAGDLARVDLYGRPKAQKQSCFGGFDATGNPMVGGNNEPEDVRVLFSPGGSCTRRAATASTRYRVGDSTLTRAQIAARLASGTPIYIVDGALSTEPKALALIGKKSEPRALLITTQFADSAGAWGIVEISTKGVRVIR